MPQPSRRVHAGMAAPACAPGARIASTGNILVISYNLRAIARLASLVRPMPRLGSKKISMLARLLPTILLTFALAGCVTVTNTVPADQIATFKLDAVTVGFADGARIWWGDGERAYAATKGIAAQDAESVSETPEAKAFIHKTISEKLKAAIERRLKGELAGTRPVRIVVRVKDVQIASVIQRIIVGGGHHLKADVDLVDARTGAVIQAYPEQTAISMAGQGIGGTMLDQALLPDPIDRVVNNFADGYGNWLLQK